MNASTILASATVVGVALSVVKIREKIASHKRTVQNEQNFQIGWQTFLAVHHATEDYALAMRIADEVQSAVKAASKQN